MSDYSLDELNAGQDVVWDFEVSSGLVEALRSAAVRVDAQVGVRNVREATYGTHFQGYYAELWAWNIETANRDAMLLASRLRDVARGARDLEADARAEQARIDAAREWKRQRDARSGWGKFWEGADVLHLFHGDANPPRIDPIPQMVKSYPSPPLEGREDFVGNKDTGVSSALPDDLRSFTRLERGSTDRARGWLASLKGLVTSRFILGCVLGVTFHGAFHR